MKRGPWKSKKKKCLAIRAGLQPKADKNAYRRSNKEIYLKLREEFLKTHKLCPVAAAGLLGVPWSRPTVDIHHKHGRVGNLLIDIRYWMAVCREGHDWIHHNPRNAMRMGWMKESIAHKMENP